jgi:hypothetical protein
MGEDAGERARGNAAPIGYGIARSLDAFPHVSNRRSLQEVHETVKYDVGFTRMPPGVSTPTTIRRTLCSRTPNRRTVFRWGGIAQRTVAALPHLRLACANQGPHPFVYAARKRSTLRKETRGLPASSGSDGAV